MCPPPTAGTLADMSTQPDRRRPPAGFLLAALVIVMLLAAACSSGGSGNPGVASLGSSSPSASSSSASASKQDALLAYAQCMRAHGLTNFPDPQSVNGGSSLDLSDVDTHSPTYQRANRACVSLLAGGSAAQQRAQARAQKRALKYAKCMRAHGIHNFPDPNVDGTFPESQMQGLGKGSPQFSAAQDACQQYLQS
jgi:hypothetical protein